MSASIRLTVRMTSSASPESRFPRLEPPFASRPTPLECRRSSRAIGRRRARHQYARVLLDPAERRHVVVRAEQDPRLTRSCLRRQVGLPLDQPMRVLREPAGEVRRGAVAHRSLQHREGEAVDLEVDDPRHVGSLPAALAPGDPLDHSQGVGVVVIGAEDHLEHHADRGHDQRGQERPAEVVHLVGVVDDATPEQEHERIQDQDQDEAERDHEGQPQGREKRREHRVQDRDHRCHQEGVPIVHHRDAGQDERGKPQCDARQQP